VHAGGSGQVCDPNGFSFGVVPKLAHSEPGQSCAPDDLIKSLGVAGSFAPSAVPSSGLVHAAGLDVDGSFASSVSCAPDDFAEGSGDAGIFAPSVVSSSRHVHTGSLASPSKIPGLALKLVPDDGPEKDLSQGYTSFAPYLAPNGGPGKVPGLAQKLVPDDGPARSWPRTTRASPPSSCQTTAPVAWASPTIFSPRSDDAASRTRASRALHRQRLSFAPAAAQMPRTGVS